MKLTKSKLKQLIKEEIERSSGHPYDFIEYIKEWVWKKNREDHLAHGKLSPEWDMLEWNTDYADTEEYGGHGLVGTIADAETRRDSRENYLEIYRETEPDFYGPSLRYEIPGASFKGDTGTTPTNAEDAEQFLEKYVWNRAKD